MELIKLTPIADLITQEEKELGVTGEVNGQQIIIKDAKGNVLRALARNVVCFMPVDPV